MKIFFIRFLYWMLQRNDSGLLLCLEIPLALQN